jgi:hypothetical protein
MLPHTGGLFQLTLALSFDTLTSEPPGTNPDFAAVPIRKIHG